jgi:hypothetical protein
MIALANFMYRNPCLSFLDSGRTLPPPGSQGGSSYHQQSPDLANDGKTTHPWRQVTLFPALLRRPRHHLNVSGRRRAGLSGGAENCGVALPC